MERLQKGRAIIERTSRGLSVEIPSKKQVFASVFLIFWLCGWLIGGVFAITRLYLGFTNGIDFGSIFLLVWLCGWAFGLFSVLKVLSNMFFGKEIIYFNRDVIIIEKKGAIIPSSKIFDKKEITNFNININADSTLGDLSNKNHLKSIKVGKGGVFKFDYGMKTIKIGLGLEEAEGRYILKKVINQGLLSDEHLL